jgi:tetratricopeptide (TPR) repeat protein
MNLLKTLHDLFGGKRPAPGPEASQPSRPECPHESEILTYCEGDPASRERASVERHLADCDDCRELVILYSHAASDQSQHESIPPLSDELIKEQAARVMGYARQDEANRSRQRGRAPKAAFGLSRMYRFAGAAVVVSALAVGGFLITRDPLRSDVGMPAVAQAVKEGRFVEGYLSGVPWSPDVTKRSSGDDGTAGNSEAYFQLALSQLKHAEQKDAPAGERYNLARVYLATGKHGHIEKGRAILEQLISDGHESAELFNDAGLAYLLLNEYDHAIEAFGKALNEDRNFHTALFNRALAAYHAGDYPSAKRDWDSFIATSTDQNQKNEASEYLKRM